MCLGGIKIIIIIIIRKLVVPFNTVFSFITRLQEGLPIRACPKVGICVEQRISYVDGNTEL